MLGCLCSAALVLAGCSRSDDAGAADTGLGTTATPAPAATPAPLALGDMAGRWNMRAVPESGDTAVTTYVMNATADTTGWTITFPNRRPIPTRVVAVSGDSLIAEAGPFESARRRGVQTRTRTVLRLEGDRLVGTTVARYVTRGADSVLTLRTEGTRAQ
jgi:hypothetical protein